MTDYFPGFGNHVSTEAVPGALPVGRNSPQRPAFGLYAEQLSGTAFTAPRHENRRSWLYRLRPSAAHPAFTRYGGAKLFAPGVVDEPFAPNRLRWGPLEVEEEQDWLDSLTTMTVAGDGPRTQAGVAMHIYRCGKDMERRAFVSGEAAFAVALNASMAAAPPPSSPAQPKAAKKPAPRGSATKKTRRRS